MPRKRKAVERQFLAAARRAHVRGASISRRTTGRPEYSRRAGCQGKTPHSGRSTQKKSASIRETVADSTTAKKKESALVLKKKGATEDLPKQPLRRENESRIDGTKGCGFLRKWDFLVVVGIPGLFMEKQKNGKSEVHFAAQQSSIPKHFHGIGIRIVQDSFFT